MYWHGGLKKHIYYNIETTCTGMEVWRNIYTNTGTYWINLVNSRSLIMWPVSMSSCDEKQVTVVNWSSRISGDQAFDRLVNFKDTEVLCALVGHPKCEDM